MSLSPGSRASSLLLSCCVVAGLSGCAGMQRTTGSLPEEKVLAALPVIKLGQPKPVEGEYIVYLPASEPVSASTLVQGSLFEKGESAHLKVRLKQDLYIYKNWLSVDKRQWVKEADAVTGNIQVRLPSYDHPQAGEVVIELNAKK